MTKSRKSAQERKAEIVETAIRLAGEQGPDRVTTQALADAIGLSQAAIFRHFPTKADIWLAVGKSITSPIVQLDKDVPQDDPLVVLQGLMERHLRQIAQNPAIPAILFSRELHAENDALRHHFETVMVARRAGLARLLEQAQKQRHLNAEVASADIAALLLASIQGLAMRWSLENQGFDLAAEGGRLISVLLGGFSPRSGNAQVLPDNPQ
ncbi:TetR/AcrR family transcriptional regulator [Sedimentitalea sp. CY04]|uniref:TetR/AcrR family transcriptional regulator n=1 Tax=Parasedimentitalea denitrificans TaxID=2211118 RepID=A0ABX0W8E4_9RHOB|nr:TetR/AcrR family transcriptional regulator [Sedimentitalea sp. CY04]NIZ61183.1 TetR/AcrR family transcriptional regulator [Sedimentitalea sp. CY04]